MPTSYKEEVSKIKDFKRIGTLDEEQIKLRKSQKKIDKPFRLEIVYNGACSFMKGKHCHGKYHTLEQAKQALEQLKKSQSWMQKYTKEYNIYHDSNKSIILVNNKIVNSK